MEEQGDENLPRRLIRPNYGAVYTFRASGKSHSGFTLQASSSRLRFSGVSLEADWQTHSGGSVAVHSLVLNLNPTVL